MTVRIYRVVSDVQQVIFKQNYKAFEQKYLKGE